MDIGVTGKRVLVTGGTRGIGRAVSVRLAESGARVVACHRTANEAATRLVEDLRELGDGHEVVQADVTEPAQVGRLVERCRQAFGELDALVNNAGVDGDVPFDELDWDEWRRVRQANLDSLFLVSKAALPLLSPGSSVVNLGAAIAARGRAGRTHHTAAKAGVSGLTKSLAKELGTHGIRVNTVAPGIIDTRASSSEEKSSHEGLTRVVALRRLGSVDDVAGAVCFLTGDLSSYVTGTTLTVDGGI